MSKWPDPILTVNGQLGINTNSPTEALEVKGKIIAKTLNLEGQLSSQNGQVRRDFITWNTTEGRSEEGRGRSKPIHIKTNIPKKSNVMYRILVEGYNYGVADAINSDIVGYTYTGWETIGQAKAHDYAQGISISQYYSSDGYVVIKLTTLDTYYLGFSASVWFTNPTGTAFDITAQVFHQIGDL